MKARKGALDQSIVPLEGSFRALPPATPSPALLNANQSITVSIRLRRKKPIESLIQERQNISREEYERLYACSEADIALVTNFARQHHLSISSISIARRTVQLTGRIRDMEAGFNVHLNNFLLPGGREFRGRTGHILVPAFLAGIVEGIFGLDNRPAAHTHHRVAKQGIRAFLPSKSLPGLNPRDVARAYRFPPGVSGKGQSIAIIELGGGFRNADLETYFKALGLGVPVVNSVGVDGAGNQPAGSADGPDGEVLLDIEVAGAVAPAAQIAVYFAPNTDQGFLNAITTAIHDTVRKPSVISISWGAAETAWTGQSMKSFNEAFKTAAALGVTICAAAGDDGSGDRVGDGKVHVDFPASSPYVLACGGTRLELNKQTIVSETVWNDSAKGEGAGGGGISDFFPVPDYQQKIKLPVAMTSKFKGRGVPDVAGN
ncbi:MAG TPA: S53 family peptidase, partial [Chitinophagaceae bacterium]